MAIASELGAMIHGRNSTIKWAFNPMEASANQREFGNVDFSQRDYYSLVG